MCLCVYGGSHSPPNRPPVLIFRAVRRDLAALAPLATGPHGRLDLGAVLARCLRGHQAVCSGVLWAPCMAQAQRCRRRYFGRGPLWPGRPSVPARQPPQPGSGDNRRPHQHIRHPRSLSGPPPAVALRAAFGPGPPSGPLGQRAWRPATWWGPLHQCSAAAPASCQGLQALPGCAALDSRPGPPHRVIIRGAWPPCPPLTGGRGKFSTAAAL